MFKLVVCAAMAAAVMADGHKKSEYEIAQESNGSVAKGAAVNIQANTVGATASFLGNGLRANQVSMDRFGDAGKQATAITEATNKAKITVDDLLKTTVAGINSKLASRRSSLISDLKARIAKLDVAGKMQETDKAINGDITKVNEALKAIQTKNKAGTDTETAIRGCSAKKQIFDAKNKKCVPAEAAADAHMQKVHHLGFEHDDGRDCGYLSHRTLNFKKKEDDTHIRVFYYDNFRVHGHTAHARWNVMFCKGGSCSHCKSPGRIMTWRYSSHQHNWWMNDHTPGTSFGLCKDTDAFKMTKGDYQVRIMIDDCRYDIYTGSGDYGSIMVDEVMRYTISVDLLRHYAEDANKSIEEIEKINEPEYKISFLADGVIIN
jgi:hypothetical protein